MTLQDIMRLPVNEQVINRTIQNTIQKYLYTIQNTSYSRTPVELLDNIFMGDFAKNLIYDYLLQNNVDIEDYDEIRTDNFQNPDSGWDLRVRNLKIEVKSSTIPQVDRDNNTNNTFQNLLDNRDIKVYAQKCNDCPLVLPQELDSDVFIQVYFPNATTYKRGYDSPEVLYRDISENPQRVAQIINIDKYFEAYYFGYLTKQDIINIYNLNQQNGNNTTWSFSWTEATYWKAPLSQAKNFPHLIHYLQ